MNNTLFEELGLSREVLKAVEDMGFEEPSPIQVLAIPRLLEGRDVIGQAHTGTGKTAAFGIPAIEKADPREKTPQVLALCPTRELAIQVAEEIGRLAARKRGLMVLPIYGGQPIDRQFRGLDRGPQIIVGTPGRILDHLERGTLALGNIRLAILDEADEMLDMGFRDDIEAILRETPEDCQTVLFSATMPPAVLDMARRFLHEPETLKIAQKLLTVPTVEQIYYEVRPHQKMDALCRVLDSQGFRKALVFCSTKRGVDEVTAHLQTRGYQADGLHGNLAQNQRDRVMGRFRTGGIEILVATDVAARGIDVDDVDAVINYDIPNDVENYVHRIGRTGRAGRAGQAFTFVTAREHYKLRDIMRHTKAHIVQSRLPTLSDVTNIKTARLLDEVRATMEAGSLERHVALVGDFLDDENTSMDMAGAMLKMLMQRDFGAQGSQEESLDAPAYDERPSRFGDRHFSDQRGDRGTRPRGRADRQGRDMVRLSFSAGSKARIAPGDLVGAIAGEAGIPGRSIGFIEIRERVSFVDIPRELADEVVRAMQGVAIRGVRVTVEKTDPKADPKA